MIYLDNSATTKPFEEAVELMAQTERQHYANASALYKIALDAEDGILRAKKEIASVLRCMCKPLPWVRTPQSRSR